MSLPFDAPVKDLAIGGPPRSRQYWCRSTASSCCRAPQAAHSNLNGPVAYQPHPPKGKMNFGYDVVPG